MSTAVKDAVRTPTVERVALLSQGDVYKRLEENSYGDPKFIYGHVIDIVNNGDKVVLSALEYGGYPVGASVKVFPPDKTLELFPALPEEVQTYIDEMVSAADGQLRTAREALFKAERTAAQVRKFRDDLSNGDVTVPITTNRR